MPRQPQAGRHRLQALALARAKHPAEVERRPEPPLPVPERGKERLQPDIQILHGPTHARLLKTSALQPGSETTQISPKSAQVVLAGQAAKAAAIAFGIVTARSTPSTSRPQMRTCSPSAARVPSRSRKRCAIW